jgi:hypothetical protein
MFYLYQSGFHMLRSSLFLLIAQRITVQSINTIFLGTIQLSISWASSVILFLTAVTPADGQRIRPNVKIDYARMVCPLESLKYNGTSSGVEKMLVDVTRKSFAASDVFNWDCPFVS